MISRFFTNGSTSGDNVDQNLILDLDHFLLFFSKMDQKLIRKNRFPDEIKNEFQKSDFSNMIQKWFSKWIKNDLNSILNS